MQNTAKKHQVDIVQIGSAVLDKKASIVPLEEINSTRIQKIIADMKTAVDSQKDGIAIAAPQIGASVRIFVVSGKVMREVDEKYKGSEDHLVFINPEILKLSKRTQEMEEGCLSVRWKYG
ncbi:MAG: peptide deformylase, partial [Patescibacteria group bacterium]|nr:peptide deformylase [Patescibacteria group bacterium]